MAKAREASSSPLSTLDQAKGLASSWGSPSPAPSLFTWLDLWLAEAPGTLPGIWLCRSHFLADDRLSIASLPALFKQNKPHP